MPQILDGKKLSELLAITLTKKVANLSIKPKLVIIQIGDLPESNTYIKNKKIFAEKIGVQTEHKKYEHDVKEREIIFDILKYNADLSVHGIIIQLPIPEHLSSHAIIESIDPNKDTDGLTSTNTKFLFDEKEVFVPSTTRGIISLLEHYQINIEGEKVVVVGQSTLVGRPTSLAFLNRKATVTICHKHTRDLAEETKRADILVVATGHMNLITPQHVSPNQVVVDIGITIVGERKIRGDVDYENVKNIVRAITPVPGGVGPMTVVSLFENLLESPSLQS